MSRIEDLLRDAYADAAQTVRPERTRPAVQLPPARSARKSFKLLAPLAAAAAVVVAISAAVTLPHLITGSRIVPGGPPKSGTPPFVIQLPYQATGVARLVVQAAGTRNVQSKINPPRGTIWRSVAATGSGTTFVAAADDTRHCVTSIYILTLSATGQPAGLKQLGSGISGQLTSEDSLAASADGRTVAYGTTQCINHGTAAPVEAIGLLTAGGTSRRWTLPPMTFIARLSLTADGSTLSYVSNTHEQPGLVGTARILPTRSPSGSAIAHSRVVLARHGSTSPSSAVLSRDGATMYILTSAGNGPYTITLSAYRTSDGTLLRALHTWRNVPVILAPTMTIAGDKLLIWGIYQPDTYQVNLGSGRVTPVWMFVARGEFPEAVAWLFRLGRRRLTRPEGAKDQAGARFGAE
jgi:hypothetical protein